MIISSKVRPLALKDLTEWLSAVGDMDLALNGWDRPRLLELLQSNECFCFFVDNTLCSLIVYIRPSEGLREILFLATRQRDQGKGYMQKLLKSFMDLEPSKIWLECREDNRAAISLYSNLGFLEAGRRPAYYKDGTAAILFNFQ